MIISRDRSFIFIHLLKCGGSSVEYAYQPHMRWSDLLLGTTPVGIKLKDIFEPRFGLGKHSAAAEVRRIIGEQAWSTYRSFVLIRHPHAQYESLFRWTSNVIRRETGGARLRTLYLRHLVRTDAQPAGFLSWPGIRERLLSHDFPSFMDAIAQTRTAPAALLPTLTDCLTAQGELLVTDVHKLEAINAAWDAMEAYLGLSLERLHRNPGAEVSIRWTKAHCIFVAERHAADFARFNYRIPDPGDLHGRALSDLRIDLSAPP